MTERLLDREAVARVLRRASELADNRQEPLPQLGGVSEQAVVDAAAEVGISADAVHRALAVERLDPLPRQHVGDRLVGAAVVAVDAEVPGSASDLLARLDAWLVGGHHLRRDRLRDGRGAWSKRSGIVGRTVRTVRLATGEGRLGLARRVCVSTSDTGAGTAVMRVQVDRSRARRSTAAGTAAAGAATAGTIVLALVAGPLVLAVTPIGMAAAVGLAGRGRSRANAVALEIDRVVDALDEHVPPTRLRTDIARRAIGRTKGGDQGAGPRHGSQPGDHPPGVRGLEQRHRRDRRRLRS